MSLVNSHCGFTPLEEDWLGDVYPYEFYDHKLDWLIDDINTN